MPRTSIGRRPSEIAVEIDALTKRFPVRRTWYEMLRRPFNSTYATAVDAVSCNILSGELFGLLGPNGAGKTTLFKMLTASTTPDAGSATVLGQDVIKQASNVRRLVSCVWANERNLFWRLSARENLRLYAALYKLHGERGSQRIDEVLQIVDLTDSGEQLVATFSSGMRQRLLIARALLPSPPLLLLDEPTRSLDPISARRFREFLRTEIVGRQGCTVILATHNSEEALDLCDRVAILDRGRLLAVGGASELAQKFGDSVFCVWTRDPGHPAIVMLDAERHARLIDVLPPERDDPWSCVRFAITGGMNHSADVLACLVSSGVEISRFEQKGVSLAELIERVVESSKETAP